jgi:hypothetical protein
MTTTLLILHGLAAVALLGALTHQVVSLLRGEPRVPSEAVVTRSTFVGRYVAVGQGAFTTAITLLYVVSVGLGAIIYPAYRLDVRIPFEEMSLSWAVGVFEIKEHWGGVGLGILPLYVYLWRPQQIATHRADRIAVTVLLAVIVWTDFLVGHVLNNIRGLA